MANQPGYFSKRIVVASFLVLTGFLIPACGGGGSEGGPAAPQYPAKTLSWEPPASYADSTPLNPATDLDSFEIYINESGTFSDVDKMAAVAAYDSQSSKVTTSFNLANLSPYLSKGVVYRVSLRAVTKNSVKSDFSPPATFSF